MLSDDVCLSVAYIGPKSRTERPTKTKIGTQVAHVTHDSDTTFKVKRSKVTRPLLTAALARQAAAAVDVGTCWPWETTATLRCARRRKALRCSRGGEGLGHIVAAARLQLVSFRWCMFCHLAVLIKLSILVT